MNSSLYCDNKSSELHTQNHSGGYTFYSELFKRMYITSDVKDTIYVQRARKRLPGATCIIIENRKDIPEKHLNSRTILLTSPRGKTVGRCPGTKGHICCNYLTIDLYVGCTLGCSYCIMQSYLNFSPITVYVEPEKQIQRVLEIANLNSDKKIRIGTGEVGDSLLFDPLFDISEEFIRAFSHVPNIFFELKTKTDFVDHLLSIPEKGNAVIGFSVNPQTMVDNEEGAAKSVKDRLKAAEKAAQSGFLVSFHFDPIFRYPEWRRDYTGLVDSIFRDYKIPADRIAWISMGTFRYPLELKDKKGGSKIFLEEFVSSKDKKFRYIQKIRSSMYSTIKQRINSYADVPIYMCMESSSVWKNVFGNLPADISQLNDIFNYAKGV